MILRLCICVAALWAMPALAGERSDAGPRVDALVLLMRDDRAVFSVRAPTPEVAPIRFEMPASRSLLAPSEQVRRGILGFEDLRVPASNYVPIGGDRAWIARPGFSAFVLDGGLTGGPEWGSQLAERSITGMDPRAMVWRGVTEAGRKQRPYNGVRAESIFVLQFSGSYENPVSLGGVAAGMLNAASR